MAKKRRSFEYQPRSKEKVKQRSEQSSSNFDSPIRPDIPTFKVTEGHHKLRILPPSWEDPDHFGMDAFVHYGIGADNDAYMCLDDMKNEACPICQERHRAEREGESDYAKELRPTKRVAVWVIDRNNEEEGPQVWMMPWTFDRDLAELMVDQTSGEVLMIDHPEEGYDIAFTREGTGIQTTYKGKQIARKQTPLSDDPDKMEQWLDYVMDNPIPSIFQYYDYDHIAKVFEGQAPPTTQEEDDEEDDEEEEDDRPARRSRSSDKGRDEEVEEDDEEDDEDEDDEEEPPRRRRRRRTSGVKEKLEESEDD